MPSFVSITDRILMLRVPFETVETSVFLLYAENGESLLFDCATTPEDVNHVILPALQAQNAAPSYIVCSHFHGDHAGGLPTLAACFPDARIGACDISLLAPYANRDTRLLQDGDLLLGCFQVLRLPGHSPDSIGILDLRTGTLLSGDSLQLEGLFGYGINTPDADAYRSSLAKLEQLPIRLLVASHDYIPLGAKADAPEKVQQYLQNCREILERIEQYVAAHTDLSAAELETLYHREFPDLPTPSQATFRNFL